jgi:transcriptional regulator with XRE-family HTH domain
VKAITYRETKIDNIKTGQAARCERLKYSITMQTLAQYMGCSTTYIYDLETGKRNWTPTLITVFNEAIDKLTESRRKP